MIGLLDNSINNGIREYKEEEEYDYNDDDDDDTTVIEWGSSEEEDDDEYGDDDDEEEEEERNEETDNQLEQKLDFLERIWSNQKLSSSVAAAATSSDHENGSDEDEDDAESLDWAAESDDEESQHGFMEEGGGANDLKMPTIMEETDSVYSALTCDVASQQEIRKREEEEDSTVAETLPPSSPSSITSLPPSPSMEYARGELLVPFPRDDNYDYNATPSIYYCRHLLLAQIRQHHLQHSRKDNLPQSSNLPKKKPRPIHPSRPSLSLRNVLSKIKDVDLNNIKKSQQQIQPQSHPSPRKKSSLQETNLASSSTVTKTTLLTFLKSFSKKNL